MSRLRAFRRPRLWLGAWAAMLAATVVVCLLPMPPIAPRIDHFDKIEHAVGYALLAAYAAMLFATRRGLLAACAGLVALGIAIEGLQALVPWRGADALDVVANTAGIAFGALLAPRGVLQWLDRRLA